MPLYTYVVTFNNSNYVGQGKYSNFKGFVSSWSAEMPNTALVGFSASLKKLLSEKVFTGEFREVVNRKGVWHKEIDLNGQRFSVHAIETKG